MSHRFFEWKNKLVTRLSAPPSMLPSSCALCGMHATDNVCAGCHEQFFSQTRSRCTQCGIPLAYDAGIPLQRCGECVKTGRAFDATVVATDYIAPVDQLVLSLKFGSRLALAPLFARMLQDAIARAAGWQNPALLAIVPLSSARLSERGFNQAMEIARPLAKAIDVPLAAGLLVRTRDTLMQARLPNDERRRNVRNAFVVASDQVLAIRGLHVAILDDVMTTGETLNEAAATLKRYGAARVTNVVFARTPPK